MQPSNLYSTQEQQAVGMCCSPLGGVIRHWDHNFGVNPNRRHNFSFMGKNHFKDEDVLSEPQVPSSLPPSQDPIPGYTDALIARELNQLSRQDREKILAEIHGVDYTEETKESPEFLDLRLKQVNQELQELPSTSAYLKAKGQNPDYASKRDLQLKFLRAESFRPKDAARRIAGFFEYKLELFGPGKLTRDIGVSELMDDPDDKKVLESGLFQRLAGRDRSGRLVVGKFHRPENAELPLASRLRVFWYVLMTAVEADIDQRRGVVLVVFNMNGIVNRVDTWKNTTLLGTLPVRVNAWHICHNNPRTSMLASLAMLAMGPYYRARLRVHEGTNIECMYTLLTFGISSDALSLRAGKKEIDLEDLKAWIQKRKQSEDRRAASVDGKKQKQKSAPPGQYDVISGRGKSTQNHPGNVRLRHWIDSSRTKYENAKLLEKTLIAERIVHTIKGLSGRFLKQDGDGGWVEVGDDLARDKISHAFRDQRRKHKQQVQEAKVSKIKGT